MQAVQYFSTSTQPKVAFRSPTEIGSGLIEVDDSDVPINHENRDR